MSNHVACYLFNFFVWLQLCSLNVKMHFLLLFAAFDKITLQTAFNKIALQIMYHSYAIFLLSYKNLLLR